MSNPSTERVETSRTTTGNRNADSGAGRTDKTADGTQSAEAEQEARQAAEDLRNGAREFTLSMLTWARRMMQEHPVLMAAAGLGVLFLTVRSRRRRS